MIVPTFGVQVIPRHKTLDPQPVIQDNTTAPSAAPEDDEVDAAEMVRQAAQRSLEFSG